MKKLSRLFASLTFMALGSTTLPAHAQDGKLSVVASFSIIGDFAKIVGGDRVELRTLVGPDSDAHVYEPRPADALALARADVILVNGLMFEGFMDRLIQASEAKAPVTVLTDGAEVLNDPKGGHYHYVDGKAIFHATPNDPHAWQSIGNAKIYVQNVAKAFCAADADGCSAYEKNAASYNEKLTALHNEIKTAVDAIPQDRRVAVVAHNAYRYFEKDYGVTFLAPQGVSTESEASAADVASIIREIREKRAAAVFAENISDARLVEQIASEAGLKLGGKLYSDALSPPDGPAASYIEMMEYNVKTIVAAISGA
ncbi:zinc/manganese transport system substrate-binding protein [Neorhizobium huautlense]|uniref:Zinc/manganese transport system substrate-binding protein n=1 Tax=Neorhizobium huautlense TaxID=67774 RepID=A0ABT9PMR9_9HYPH|nr:zinc ABC transporter substrate-binding protein AztC [Neorhizobium huautlense]MDP9835506.1 zinc/manganese transport system substrate-binding protein [Neorhizobium huautlense]